MDWIFSLAQALIDGVVTSAFSSSSTGEDELTPLEVELEELYSLLAPYNLKLTVTDSAREAMVARVADERSAKAFVRVNIRTPLAKRIQRGDIHNGQRIIVDWDEGIQLRVVGG